MSKFVIYKDQASQYRWRLKAANGKIIADSAEGFTTLSYARESVALVKSLAPGATVEEPVLSSWFR